VVQLNEGDAIAIDWHMTVYKVLARWSLCNEFFFPEGNCNIVQLVSQSAEFGQELQPHEGLIFPRLVASQECFSFAAALAFETHSSLADNGQRSGEGLSLEDCLDAFTQEEKINEVRVCIRLVLLDRGIRPDGGRMCVPERKRLPQPLRRPERGMVSWTDFQFLFASF
jgi:hypothetical protein